jgi:hypothetical protein
MFQALAQKVKDAAVAEINVNEENESNQHSILENLQLPEEHFVFKFSSIDPRVKCYEIVILQGAIYLVEIKGSTILVNNHLHWLTQIHYHQPSPKVPDTPGHHL